MKELARPMTRLRAFWTAENLREARPEITIAEIAHVLGVTHYDAALLLQAADHQD